MLFHQLRICAFLLQFNFIADGLVSLALHVVGLSECEELLLLNPLLFFLELYLLLHLRHQLLLIITPLLFVCNFAAPHFLKLVAPNLLYLSRLLLVVLLINFHLILVVADLLQHQAVVPLF